MNDGITLYYFPFNGRAAIIRAILTYSNIPFENKTIKKEEWPEHKESGIFEFGQMPAIKINGKLYVQTLAIEIYLCRKYNLLGSNLEEEYEIFNLLCSRDDYFSKIQPLIMPASEKEKTESGRYLKEFIDYSKNYFKILENKLAKSEGKYILGNKFSLADIYVTIHLYMIFKQPCRRDSFESLLKDNSPKVNDYIESIVSNELSVYFKNVYDHESFI